MGWTSLACLILFIGGCQLLVLGAIGEYLGRTYIFISMVSLNIRSKKL